MRAIFISYRRDDTEGHAGRLFEDLCDRFGKAAVFMDVAGIEPGRDFRRAIEQQVASCGVLLAVIGKNWLTVTDRDGKRRLDDPYDFVRLETASALKRDIPVIPVLVHDAAMPRAEQLPDDLKELAFRNSVELTHARWPSDVQLLINALLPHVDAAPRAPAPVPTPPPSPPAVGRHTPWLVAPLAVLALGGIGYVAWSRLAPTPAPPPSDAAFGSGRPIAVAPPASAPASAPAAVPASAPAPVMVAAAPASAPAPVTVIAKPSPAPKPVVMASRPSPSPAAGPLSAPAPAASPAPAPVAAPLPAASPVPTPAPAPSSEVLASRDPGSDLYGSAAVVAMVTRTIVIKPDTGYVNVTGGEVIRFNVGGKSFVWNFNGTRSSFDLGLIAPAGLLGRKVTAYVAPNPMYPKRS